MSLVHEREIFGNHLPAGVSERDIDAPLYSPRHDESEYAAELSGDAFAAAVATFGRRHLTDVIASLDDQSDAQIGAMVRRKWNQVAGENAP